MERKNRTCVITGAGGLIGSECVKYYANKFEKVIGIDCDARKEFFGPQASVLPTIQYLIDNYRNFEYINADITHAGWLLITSFTSKVDLIIHCAAQPSHDWAATDPHRDFSVNAVGTLNLLELYRKQCPEAVFIFTSTNKVYGDTPNKISFTEEETRYEAYQTIRDHYTLEYKLVRETKLFPGISEHMSIDQTTHSLFGVSKAAADLMVQEYGRYFGLATGVFRGGCLTGPAHQGAEQHGFLSYLVKCIKNEIPYTVYGYKGKQVRDQIHSADVVRAFQEFYLSPRPGSVYNIGGGRHSNCSVLEAIAIIERKTGKKAIFHIVDDNRRGDHQWYITDMIKFKRDYPNWDYIYTLDKIIDELIETA